MPSTKPEAASPSRRLLLAGLLSGPLIWAAYFMAGYGLVEAVCKTGRVEAPLLGLPILSIVIVMLTLVSLLGTLYAGAVAFRNWQQARRAEADRGNERTRFMTSAGLLLDALFAFTILLTSLPFLILRLCD